MKILFAGEGGQGVQSVAEILAKAAFNEGLASLYIPNFGVEQRGGVSLAFVTVDSKPVVYPKFEKADLLAIFSDRSLARAKPYLGPKTTTIFGPATSHKKAIKVNKLPTKTWNIVLLSQVNRLGKIVPPEALIKAMDERFSRQYQQNPALKKINLEALNYESL